MCGELPDQPSNIRLASHQSAAGGLLPRFDSCRRIAHSPALTPEQTFKKPHCDILDGVTVALADNNAAAWTGDAHELRHGFVDGRYVHEDAPAQHATKRAVTEFEVGQVRYLQGDPVAQSLSGDCPPGDIKDCLGKIDADYGVPSRQKMHRFGARPTTGVQDRFTTGRAVPRREVIEGLPIEPLVLGSSEAG